MIHQHQVTDFDKMPRPNKNETQCVPPMKRMYSNERLYCKPQLTDNFYPNMSGFNDQLLHGGGCIIMSRWQIVVLVDLGMVNATQGHLNHDYMYIPVAVFIS